MKRFLPCIMLMFVITVTGCNKNIINDIKRGANYNYQPGHPELRLEVSEHVDENEQPLLGVTGHVVENSLIFKLVEDSLRADFQIDIEILNVNTNKKKESNFRRVLKRGPSHTFTGEKIFSFDRQFEVGPGNYEVTILLTDLATNKQISRSTEAFLPNPAKTALYITNINLLTKKEGGSFEPSTTYDIGVDADSIRFQFQVINNSNEPLIIRSRLIQFKTDTTHASPMSFSNPSASSIRYKGIDYGASEVIQQSRREFGQTGNVVIEYNFENLQRGNYRFEVEQDIEGDNSFYKARDFGVKSSNYPAITTPAEMAGPLVYLMSEQEYEELLSLETDEALKDAVDRFWLGNIKNSVKARSTISLFYSRVEEANKFFATYKEGWKTDMGMIYILFGPPLDEDIRLREIKWAYRFNQDDPEYTYFFRNIKTRTATYPFHNYMLRRDNRYFNIEYRQRQLWRTGHILTKTFN